MWTCAWNLDEANIIYAGLSSGRVQVFDRRQVSSGETTLSSSVETLSVSTTSPVISLQYIQKNTVFQLSGLIVGTNDKSGFYEYVPNSEYRYHPLPLESRRSPLPNGSLSNTNVSFSHWNNKLEENLSSLHYDPIINRLLASFRPPASPARHEFYELTTRAIEDAEQTLSVSLNLIQTFIGSSINIVLSRSKIVHKNLETYIVASDNGSHGVCFIWNVETRNSIDCLIVNRLNYGIFVSRQTVPLSKCQHNVILLTFVWHDNIYAL